MKGPYAEDSGDTETTRYEFSSLMIDLRRPKYVRDEKITMCLGGCSLR